MLVIRNSALIVSWPFFVRFIKTFSEFLFLFCLYLSPTNRTFIISLEPLFKTFGVEKMFMIMGEGSNVTLAIFKFLHANDALGHAVQLLMKLSMD